MRPSRLVMRNFGAWRERTEIDFSLLASVFLVCGKTGSGKTTIFDALTYALYGAAPGARDGLESQLWSHHAAPGDKPLVEFEFFLGDAEFRAVRVPPYKRPRRGGGLTDVPPEACIFRRERRLRDGNGTPVAPGEWVLVHDSIRETNQFIESRIGLTVDEFSKIILLPQGEFQRFLQMASTDRVAVLEKLFPVDLHDKVTTLAKDRSRELVQTVKRIDDEIARISSETGPDVQARLAGLRQEGLVLQLETERAVNAVAAADAELEKGVREAGKRKQFAEAVKRLASLESRQSDHSMMAEKVAVARRAAAVLPLVERAQRAADRRAKALQLRDDRLALIAGFESRSGDIAQSRIRLETLEAETRKADTEIGELQGAASAWSRAVAAESAWVKAAAEQKRLETLLEGAVLRQASLASELSAASIPSEVEADIRSRFDAARSESERAQRRLDAVSGLIRLEKTCESASVEVERAESALRLAAGKSARAQTALEACEAKRAADAAVSLAANLEEGKACPVCGSTSHPAPAALSGSGVSEAERQRLKKECEKARMAESSALGARSAALASCGEREKSQAEAWTSYVSTFLPSFVPTFLPDDLTGFPGGSPEGLSGGSPGDLAPQAADENLAARTDLDSRNAALVTAGAALDSLLEARKKAEILAPALDAAHAAVDKAREKLARVRDTCVQLKGSLDEAKNQAGGVDPKPRLDALSASRDSARLRMAESRTGIESWERGVADARTMFSEADRQVAECKTEDEAASSGAATALEDAGFAMAAEVRAGFLPESGIARLESAVVSFGRDLSAALSEVATLKSAMSGDESAVPDLVALENRTREARAAFDAASARQGQAAAVRDRLESLVADLAARRAEREALGGKQAALFALSELLSGNLSGRRLPFKNFVLGAYFQTVVRNAGARLSDMSDGRFTLVADEGSARGQGRIGLEILVLDSYTGQARPSGTLSGGERFLTAISLAFGLSDTIRQRSGGVALDAIFIDEGFGSLDEEALDRAISVLDRVRGNRMIGIVSHVAELRARIPSQIVVTKGRTGSTLEISG